MRKYPGKILFSIMILLLSGQVTGQGIKVKNGTTIRMSGGTTHLVIDDNLMNGQGNLTIEAGATVTADGLLKIDGSFSNFGVFNSGTSNLALSGSFLQTLTGSATFYDLSIENTSGGVDLGNAFLVSNLLTLTSGNINTTASNLMTVDGSANTSGGVLSSFINGPIEFNTPSNSGNHSFLFPTGKNSNFQPFQILINQSDNNSTGYIGEYFDAAQSGAVDASISFPQIGFWTIDNGGATNFSSAQIILPFDPANFSIGEKVLVLRKNGGTWESLGGQNFEPGLDTVFNTVGFTSWGEFTIGRLLRPVANATITDNTNCDPAIFNGELAGDVGGLTAGFDFYWFDGNIAMPDTTSADFKGTVYSGLSGGDYTLVAVDQLDRCESLPFVATVMDNLSVPVPNVAINSDQTICDPAFADGELQADVGGTVTGFTFYWFNGNIAIPDTTLADFKGALYTGLIAGDYTLLTLDESSQCLSVPLVASVSNFTIIPAINVVITDQTLCDPALVDGALSADVGGITSGFTFEWYSGTIVDPLNLISSGPTINNLLAGDYTVSAINDLTFCSDQQTVNVPFNPALPVALITNTTVSVCEGEDVVLEIGLTGIDPFLIRLIDNLGNPYSFSINAGMDLVIPGLIPGNYVIDLDSIADGSGCGLNLAGLNWNVTINETPLGDISGMDSEICEGEATSISMNFVSGVGPYDVLLERNSGALADTLITGVNSGDMVPVIPKESTSYKIKSLTDTGSGCSNVDASSFLVERMISVNPKPNADAGNDQTVCVGDIAPLDASNSSGTGSLSYSWSSGSVLDNPSSPTPNFNTSLIGPGNYEFIVTITDSKSCVQFDTVEVTVNPVPDGIISIAGNTTICEGDQIDLNFQLLGGGPFTVIYNDGSADLTLPDISNGHNEPLIPTVSTTYTLVSVTDNAGCPNPIGTSTSVTVNNLPQVLIDIEPTVICAGETVVITATGATNYTMSIGGNTLSQLSPGVAEFTSSIDDSGNLEVLVTGTDANNCNSLETSSTFEVVPLPDTDFEIPEGRITCSNIESLRLVPVVEGGVFTIDGNPISGNVLNPSEFATGNYELVYSVTVNGCTSNSLPQRLDILDVPDPDFTVSEPLTIGVPVDFTSTINAADYSWDFGDGNTGGGATTAHTYKKAGTMNVKLTVTTVDGCMNEVINPILIGALPVQVMNVITPNGDPFNSNMYIKDIEFYPENEVKVLNRWGSEVYSTNNYDNDSNFWDGTISGKVVSPGNYICVIKINALDLTLKQTVAIIQ